MLTPTTFEQAMAIVFATEGGFTADPRDPGNWTGGKPNLGVCKGTNFGISAKSYPDLDIRNLSKAQAHDIYERDYWNKFHCDVIPPPLALLVFDCAVNGGHPIEWLQQSVGANPDGDFGKITKSAIDLHAGQGAIVCASFLALRLDYMMSLAVWPTFKHAWIRRICDLPYLAMRMT